MASSVHAKVISVKISSSAEGNAQCSSLQDLMRGFTSGAIRIYSYSENQQFPGAGCVVAKNFDKQGQYEDCNVDYGILETLPATTPNGRKMKTICCKGGHKEFTSK
jgi:hypothetical protein